jgi:CRP-like cAMP-binding protein
VGLAKQVPAGTYVFREGELLDRFFVLEQGSIELRKGIAGKSTLVHTAGADSVLGLMPALDGLPCSLSACAAEECRVIEVSRETLHAMLRGEHDGGIDAALALTVQSIRALRRSTDVLALAIYDAMRTPNPTATDHDANLAKVQAWTNAWLAA